MQGVDSPSFWSSFPHDPRDPAHAPLRASDHDREVVQRALAEAYAEGRLDRGEHDERSATVAGARTLGELPPLVADLLPHPPVRRPGSELLGATSAELRTRAEQAWRTDLRQAASAFLFPTLVCWAVWFLTTGPDGYPWPAWVMLGTGLPLLRAVLRQREIVERHQRRLERRQAKERRTRELGS